MAATRSKLRALFVDDDVWESSCYVRLLEAEDFIVDYAHSVDKGLEAAMARQYDAVVIDIRMPPGDFFTQFETVHGFKTGIELGKEVADLQPTAIIVALTISREADVEAWFTRREQFAYYCKRDVEPEDLPLILRNRILKVIDMPEIFIVHGHDYQSALALKNYLQNTLKLPEPVILSEQPSHGLTIIEKFEHYAKDVDLVFALFTPDDFKGDSLTEGRARQNVIFEFGYFLGSLGRRSGRVFLLYKGNVELPSDLHGIIYVDISGGIEAAGEQIRRELRGFME